MSSGAKLLSDAHNFAVVQMEGRRFPGVVMQGDALSILVDEIKYARELLDKGDAAQLKDLLDDPFDRFEGAKIGYERVCTENGIKLPYFESG